MAIVPTKGPQRDRLSDATVTKIQSQVPRLKDERRRRPLYFDGRFLAARDLTREQDYFLARQADLGRAGGAGVVTGLVAKESDGRIVISPGHGITPSGEMVALTEPLTIHPNFPDITEAVRVRLFVSRPIEPKGSTRTGLFIVALRPVEYEANPIAQYPTTLDGERGIHNGDIVEATAITLIPYPDLGDPTELRFRRAHAAKEIFVDGARPGNVTDALPIAMVAIERGQLLWVDPHLVRREIGAEAGDILGVSGAPLALREAFLLQYDDHLRDVLTTVHGGIVASDHFLALPPAGVMPKSAIDRQRFTQRFFPAEVDVDISVIPSDELGALLEEARLLPPIDLTAPDELRGTSILVLVPVDRQDLSAARAPLVGARRALPAAAPNLLAKKRPLDRLAALSVARQPLTQAVAAVTPEDKAWRDLLDLNRADDLVWYVRRKTLSHKPQVVAEIETTPAQGLKKLVESLKEYGLTELDASRIQNITWQAADEIVAKINKDSRLFAAAAVVELGLAPAFAKSADAASWAKYLGNRFAIARSQAVIELEKIFVPGKLRTSVLVRTAMLRELITPFSKLLESSRMAAWRKALDDVETKSGEQIAKVDAIRRLLFAVLDIQEEKQEPEPEPPEPQPGDDKMRVVPGGFLPAYQLTDLEVDKDAWTTLEPWVLSMDRTQFEATRLLAASAIVELSDAGPLAHPGVFAQSLMEKYDVLTDLRPALSGGGAGTGLPPSVVGRPDEPPEPVRPDLDPNDTTINEVLVDIGPLLARTRRVLELVGYCKKNPTKIITTLVALEKEALKHVAIQEKIKYLKSLIEEIAGVR